MSTIPLQSGAPLLEVSGLTVNFQRHGRPRHGQQHLTAIDEVSLQVRHGEILGLVGESGSGKTTLGRAILRLVPVTSGSVRLDGHELCGLGNAQLRPWRRRMQIIFQDPAASLSPRRTIGQTLREPLQQFARWPASQHPQKILASLEAVGLDHGALARYPHQFSSGQRQRIMIARALVSEPDLVIADEIVSALDVSVQAQILQLIKRLQEERGIAFIFISHDLAVIQQVAQRVAVMYAGRLVETASAAKFFRQPAHPYAQHLLGSVPPLSTTRNPVTPSALASILAPADRRACVFRHGCASAMEVCGQQPPADRPVTDSAEHQVKCHLYPLTSAAPD